MKPKYHMLFVLNEKLKEQPDNQREYVSTVIGEFNYLMTKFINWEDNRLKQYLLDLIRIDYKIKTDNMLPQYDEDVVSYLKNYISAKLKNTINDNKY